MPGERDLSFYEAEMRPERPAAVWLYMSINEDERITEIWACRLEADFVFHAALIVGPLVTISSPFP